MTRKHFQALADALLSTKPEGLTFDEFQVWTSTVSAVATVCGQFNPNFDRQKFLRAAGA